MAQYQTRWEYKFLTVDKAKGQNPLTELNKAGAEGWRVIHIYIVSPTGGGEFEYTLERLVREEI